MSRSINTGTTANDGSGDSARSAFQKINSNFERLPRTVKTIADLVAADPVSLSVDPVPLGSASFEARVLVEEYNPGTRRGGGIFRWVPGGAETLGIGGYTFNAAGGQWIREDPGDWINVEHFGAIGDNATDCTTSMQAAIDFARAKRRGIYLPAPLGTISIYRITGTLNCLYTDTAAGFAGIRGEGIGRSRINMATDNLPIMNLTGLGLVLEDLTLRYANIQPAANTAAVAIRVPGWVWFSAFRNLEIVNAGTGIYNAPPDVGNQTIFSTTFDNVTIRDFSNYGIRYAATSGNMLVNVYFSCPNQPSAISAYWNEAGSDWIGQMNIEHANFRGPAFKYVHAGIVIGTLHLEGLRNIGSQTLVDISRAPLVANQITLLNSYMGGYKLVSLTAVGNLATATLDLEGGFVTGGNGFVVGDAVKVAGATDALYNGTFTVTAVTATTVSFTLGGSPAGAAVVDLAGGSDYLALSHLGSPFPRIFGTNGYSGGEARILNLQLHKNRTIGANNSDRSGFFLVGENADDKCSVRVDSLTLGTAFNAGTKYLRGGMPVEGSGRTSNVLTVWTRNPHGLSIGDLVSMNAGGGTSESRLTVTGVPTAFSFTAASTGVNYGPQKEISGTVTVKCGWVVTRSRSGNIATLELDQAHQLFTGCEIMVRQMSSAGYNSTTAVVLTVPSPTSITYRSVGTDEASTAESTGAVAAFDTGLSSIFTPSSSQSVKQVGLWGENLAFLSNQTISAGTAFSEVLNVNLVRLGDSVRVTPFSNADFPDGLIVSAHVNAANQVTVKRYNATAGGITHGNIPVNIEIQRR